MNAKEIAKRVMRTKYAGIITDTDGRQWITDGTNAYLADESVPLNDENILSVLDIAPDKREKIRVGEQGTDATKTCVSRILQPAVSMMPMRGDREMIPGLSICYNGDVLTSLQDAAGDGRIKWVRQGYIKPADGPNGLGFFMRGMLVALYQDMLCNAVVAPERDEIEELIEKTICDMYADEMKKEIEGGNDND